MSVFGVEIKTHQRVGGIINDLFVGGRTPNPNKCTHYLRTISTKIEIISLTTMRVSEKSSDLDSGRRPESKSDDSSDTRIVVSEI